jgi:hypothetical protein
MSATNTTQCETCVFHRTKPLDCIIVPPDTVRRSLLVVSRLWAAEEKPCQEFTPRATGDDLSWASAMLRFHPRSRWANRVLDCSKLMGARDGDEALAIMVESMDRR